MQSKQDDDAGDPGYFDAAAGVPLHPAAAEAFNAAYADGWADPSRLTGAGRRSAVLLDAARQAVADQLSVRATEVSFVSSGAHALQLGVLGALAGRARAGSVLVHSAVEHSAVLRAAQWHVDRGGEAVSVGVDLNGRVDPAEFLAACRRPGVAVAVLQAANHEVGVRQPVAAVAAGLDALGIPLVVDCSHDILYGEPPSAAAVFTADARLWGGPDVGILVVRAGTRWREPLPAGEAEHGHVAGAAPVPAIVAAAAALRAHRAERHATGEHLRRLTHLIRERVPAVADCEVLGDPVDTLAHLLTFSVLYAGGEALLTELDRRGFSVSSGSSCTADTLTPSHVLVAMGALTSGNIRVSLPPAATEAAVRRFLHELPAAVEAVRGEHPDRAPKTGALQTGARHTTAGQTVDSRGRRCPLPILDLARALPTIAVGAELTVLADDPAAAADIAAWCRMRGQQLLTADSHPDGGQAYRVRRLR